MKLERLKLRGAIGIKKNMGQDEIELDFSKLGPGLTALTGPNGMGKTTVLENMHPYRTLGSRPGALQNHFFLPDSFRELSFSIGDDHYRAVIKMNGESGRTEAFLYKNGDEKSLVNGSATKYDAAIKELMGSKELFFNSAFTAQNSDSLSDLKTHELKTLIGEFINLDRYIKFEKTANSCSGILNGRADTLSGEISDCQRDIDALPVSVELVNIEQENIDEIAIEIKTLTNEAGAILEQIEAHKEVQVKNEKLQAEQSLLLKQTQDLSADIESYKAQKADEVAKIHSEKSKSLTVAIAENQKQATDATTEAEAALKETDQKLNETAITISQLTTKIENAPDILQVKDDLERAKVSLSLLRQESTELQGQQDKLSRDIDDNRDKTAKVKDRWAIDREAFDKRIRTAETLYHSLTEAINTDQVLVDDLEDDQSLFNMTMRLELVQQQTEILDTIDPGCTSTTCGAIAHALKAKESMKPIKLDIEKRKAELDKIEADSIERIKKSTTELDKAQQAIENEGAEKLAAYEIVTKAVSDGNAVLETLLIGYKKVSDQLAEIRWAIDATERAIDIYNAAVEDNADLSAARERLSAAKHEESRLKTEKTNLNQRHESVMANIQKEIDRLEALLHDVRQHGCPDSKDAAGRWDRLINRAMEKKDRAQQAIFDIEKMVDEQVNMAIATLREKHGNITEQISKLTNQNMRATQRLTQLKTQLAQKTALQKQLARLIAEQTGINNEAREWAYLRNACSKDGFRALEIDSVAPAIAASANDLLHSAFGSGTSIEIITQDPETGKEILDIMVHTADGDCTEITLFSGGEKVWLLKACRLALTMISKERSGRIIQTCFADEEDGALDPDKAMQFVNLYRSFYRTGRFLYRLLYLTQTGVHQHGRQPNPIFITWSIYQLTEPPVDRARKNPESYRPQGHNKEGL